MYSGKQVHKSEVFRTNSLKVDFGGKAYSSAKIRHSIDIKKVDITKTFKIIYK